MEYFFPARKDWRKWLEKNHSAGGEIWIKIYKKASGIRCLGYEEAVEEALCFGWIDGKIKSINKDYYIQRYTPRRPGSRWSKYNIERVQRLTASGHMRKAGMDAYGELLIKPHLAYENRSDGDPEMPADLMKALSDNVEALRNFNGFPPSARRMYIEWLNDARRADTRVRRIARIISRSEKNIKPGVI